VTLVDVGANTEVRAEHLVQFAFMGAALAQVVHGIERPRVALLSIGEESTRGTPLVVDVNQRLRAATGLRFIGNIEGHALVEGKADVVVTDGFTGNVTLKVMEGVSDKMIALLRESAASTNRAKAGGMLMRPALRAMRDELHPEIAGGGYLLGLRKVGVVGHGRFTSRGFAQAILLAARGVSGDVVGRTHQSLERAGALRRGGAALSETPSSVSAVDELEVDPARIDDGTNFRVDLEADSLDLYTLVQELEDSYGVKMSDQQAAKIVTVGQAVDFVLANAAAREPSES
jgi:glycerol-3-phosphate acyltransferase PlsX